MQNFSIFKGREKRKIFFIFRILESESWNYTNAGCIKMQEGAGVVTRSVLKRQSGVVRGVLKRQVVVTRVPKRSQNDQIERGAAF